MPGSAFSTAASMKTARPITGCNGKEDILGDYKDMIADARADKFDGELLTGRINDRFLAIWNLTGSMEACYVTQCVAEVEQKFRRRTGISAISAPNMNKTIFR